MNDLSRMWERFYTMQHFLNLFVNFAPRFTKGCFRLGAKGLEQPLPDTILVNMNIVKTEENTSPCGELGKFISRLQRTSRLPIGTLCKKIRISNRYYYFTKSGNDIRISYYIKILNHLIREYYDTPEEKKQIYEAFGRLMIEGWEDKDEFL